MKVMFIEARAKLKEIKLDRAIIALNNYKKICLVSTVQFLDLLPEVKNILEKAKKIVIIEMPKLHAIKPGQLLGCDVTATPADYDCVLYIGTGRFHSLGIKQQKPIFKLDPFTGQVEKISENEIRKAQLQQQARIAKFKEAKIIGILITLKPGQHELQGKVEELKAKLEKQGKEVFVFMSDTISPADLTNFPQVEAWVNTACPRIVDDQELYNKPIVNASEID